MTIRFLKAWNGYSPDAVATLSAGLETTLKAAGIARDSSVRDGPDFGGGALAEYSLDPTTGAVTGLVGPDGGVVPGLVNSAGAAVMQIRYVNWPSYNTFDTSSFRQIWQVPFQGPCLVRAVYETDATSVSTVSNCAFAAGRNYSDDDPVDASGSPATWQLQTAIALTAASASFSTDGVYGFGKSGWVFLNIPAPTDGGLGGYVYTTTKLASGTGRGIVGNAARPTNDWESAISGLLPSMKYRALYKSGDFATTSQNGMGAAVPTKNSQFNPVAYLELIPMTRSIAVAGFGDSTTQGLGTGTPAVQPYNYNPGHVAAYLMQSQRGKPVHFANFASEGKTSTFYLKRLETLLADDDFRPTFVFIQPISRNDNGGVYSAASINSAISSAIQLAASCRKKNIIPIFRTALPDSTTNSTTDAYRKTGNDMIRASGVLCLDMDSMFSDGATPARIVSSHTYDGTHLNKTANDIAGAALASILCRSLME